MLLYNFGTRYLGLNLYQRADLSSYADVSRVDNWGLEAMRWAVGAGILSSTTPGELVLEPQSSATRAQVAVMLQNFVLLRRLRQRRRQSLRLREQLRLRLRLRQ